MFVAEQAKFWRPKGKQNRERSAAERPGRVESHKHAEPKCTVVECYSTDPVAVLRFAPVLLCGRSGSAFVDPYRWAKPEHSWNVSPGCVSQLPVDSTLPVKSDRYGEPLSRLKSMLKSCARTGHGSQWEVGSGPETASRQEADGRKQRAWWRLLLILPVLLLSKKPEGRASSPSVN